MLPNENIVSREIHTQAVCKYGDYVVKLALLPNTESQKKLSEQKLKSGVPDYIPSERRLVIRRGCVGEMR